LERWHKGEPAWQKVTVFLIRTCYRWFLRLLVLPFPPLFIIIIIIMIVVIFVTPEVVVVGV
jgi:hypothetical protein